MGWSVGSEDLEVKFDSGRSVKGPVPFLFDEEGTEIRRIGSLEDQIFISVKTSEPTGATTEFRFTILSSFSQGQFFIGITEFALGTPHVSLTREQREEITRSFSMRLSAAVHAHPAFFTRGMEQPSRSVEVLFDGFPQSS